MLMYELHTQHRLTEVSTQCYDKDLNLTEKVLLKPENNS